jgi:hypothetical protein
MHVVAGMILIALHQADKFSSPPSKRNAQDHSTYTFIPNEKSDDYHDTNEATQPLQSGFTLAQSRQSLPSGDIDSGIKIQCLLAIALGIVCSLTCITCSIGIWATSGYPVILLPQSLPGEALSFIANLILTQCLDGLAYVHSISLRWALLKEDRLVFNTNLRLLTSSSLSWPNSRYINAASATLLILCYGSTSFLVLQEVNRFEGKFSNQYINLIAVLVLGLALSGQTLLAIWCYYNNLRAIPTWSSNALNTTMTMLKQQMIQHREGRCLSSVQIPDTPEARPLTPRTTQPSIWQASSSARHANIFTWILVGFSVIWFLVVLLVARSNMLGAIRMIREMGGVIPSNATWHFTSAWNPLTTSDVESITYTTYFNAIFFGLEPSAQGAAGSAMPFVASLIVSLLFISAIQGLQTLGLHCAELIVNLSRDEDTWRALDAQGRSRTTKHVLMTPPFFAALFSWKYDMLQVFKSLLHWLLGQSMQPAFGQSSSVNAVYFTMNYVRLLVYVICTIIFASAITFLAFKKPKSPQPVTYGHIQTLADVIDDWTLDDDGRFWWGDKGYTGGVRHAGMSAKRNNLGPIQMDALYAGEARSENCGSTKLSIHLSNLL